MAGLPLPNPKQEAFAQNLARGEKTGQAYVDAGYSFNSAGASRLAANPRIIERVNEIKDFNSKKIMATMTTMEIADFENLAEMGITYNYVAKAFMDIYEKALDSNQLAPANTAVQNLQKMLEIEERAGKGEEPDAVERIAVTDTIKMLEAMSKAIKVANESTATDVIEIVDAEDITPTESSELTNSLKLLSEMEGLSG